MKIKAILICLLIILGLGLVFIFTTPKMLGTLSIQRNDPEQTTIKITGIKKDAEESNYKFKVGFTWKTMSDLTDRSSSANLTIVAPENYELVIFNNDIEIAIVEEFSIDDGNTVDIVPIIDYELLKGNIKVTLRKIK